MQDSI